MKGRGQKGREVLVLVTSERSRKFDQETTAWWSPLTFHLIIAHIIDVIIRAPRDIPFHDGFLFLIVVTSIDLSLISILF